MSLEEQIAAEKAEQAKAEEISKQLIARGHEIAKMMEESVNDSRAESLAKAEQLGADLSVLRIVASAQRLARKNKIELPRGRYGHCSRGREWCRNLDGSGFIDDHIVGPGKYAVGSNDGFKRKDRVEWEVKHVQVGEETWTVAN